MPGAQIDFWTQLNPDAGMLEALSNLDPCNPFVTPAFVEAYRRPKTQAWILGLRQGVTLISGCVGFVSAGRLNRRLEIPSLPSIENKQVFWNGLLAFCRKNRISILEINSFGSVRAEIPPLPGETSRTQRCEYVLDLSDRDLGSRISSHHKRNIRRAERSGLQLHRARTSVACAEHARLIAMSMDRRHARGESVSSAVALDILEAFIRTGVGEIFQAVKDDTVLSSILVLKGRKGAYYQSAGTSPEGMTIGAAPFLVHETAKALLAESFISFNLGGAVSSNPGLVRFKSGFGPDERSLVAVEAFVGSRLKKKLTTAAGLLRRGPKALLQAMIRIDQSVVYSAEPGTIHPPQQMQGLTFRRLTDSELNCLPADDEDLRLQHDRLERLGFNQAFGLFKGADLAHIAWLITSDLDKGIKQRNLKLRAGEAEITHCLTLPAYRGQGFYPIAIRLLCGEAIRLGVRKVFMITHYRNRASMRGIEKAGFVRTGRIVRVTLPFLSSSPGFTFRGHRWFGFFRRM